MPNESTAAASSTSTGIARQKPVAEANLRPAGPPTTVLAARTTGSLRDGE
jgi:hypothetical protein